jgi:hypothetical protein
MSTVYELARERRGGHRARAATAQAPSSSRSCDHQRPLADPPSTGDDDETRPGRPVARRPALSRAAGTTATVRGGRARSAAAAGPLVGVLEAVRVLVVGGGCSGARPGPVAARRPDRHRGAGGPGNAGIAAEVDRCRWTSTDRAVAELAGDSRSTWSWSALRCRWSPAPATPSGSGHRLLRAVAGRGPSEGSKAFAKEVMAAAVCRPARSVVCTTPDEAPPHWTSSGRRTS